MIAEILSIGTELLLGDTVNTNAAYLAKELSGCGYDCYYQSVVGDNQQRLKESISLAISRSDVLITTGGLGPTYDDMTKETISAYFSRPLLLHQPSYDYLVEGFKHYGITMTENNIKQAYMPEGAIVFPNTKGTANGLAIEDSGKTVIMLPGPPREVKSLFETHIREYLLERSHSLLVSHTIHFFGIGESALEHELHKYMLDKSNPTIAPYAKEGEVVLRVTAKADITEEAETLCNAVVKEICSQYKGYIYGVDVKSLENTLVCLLREQNLTIATAEGCTGGLISKRITDIEGSSDVFGYGVCSNSREAILNLSHVPKSIVEQYGEVSEETVIIMAEEIRKTSNSDIGLAITGTATIDKTSNLSSGDVIIAINYLSKTHLQRLSLSIRGYERDREQVRWLAASHALHLVLQTVQLNITQ